MSSPRPTSEQHPLLRPRRRRLATVPVKPSARRRLSWPSRVVEIFAWTATTIALCVAFTMLSSLAGIVTEHRIWMLACGLSATIVVPFASAVALSRRSVMARQLLFTPRRLLLWSQLALIFLLLLTGGRPLHRALLLRGHWWVVAAAHAVGLPHSSAVVELGDSAARALAAWVPLGRRSRVARRGASPMARDREIVAAREVADRRDSETVSSPTKAAFASSPSKRADTLTDGGSWRTLSYAAPAEPPIDAGSLGTPGRVAVPFERRGGAIIVPVTVFGPEASARVHMLFDTGASLTTIDSRTLSQLGLYVSSADPTVTLRTANGMAQRTVTVIDGAALGSARVDGALAVALCDSCAADDVVGLLGTNFSHYFRVTVDHQTSELLLEPIAGAEERQSDTRLFLGLQNGRGEQRGTTFHISVDVYNQAPREIRDVRIHADIPGQATGEIVGVLTFVPPRGHARLDFAGTVAARVERFSLAIDHARW